MQTNMIRSRKPYRYELHISLDASASVTTLPSAGIVCLFSFISYFTSSTGLIGGNL